MTMKSRLITMTFLLMAGGAQAQEHKFIDCAYHDDDMRYHCTMDWDHVVVDNQPMCPQASKPMGNKIEEIRQACHAEAEGNSTLRTTESKHVREQACFRQHQVATEALGLGVHEDAGAVSGLIAKLLKEGEITFLGKKEGCSQYMILKPIRSFERPLAKEYKGGKPGRTMGRRPITNINIEEYKEPGSLPVYTPIG
ncbi:unnamed protein product [Sphagnum balticum]